MQYGAENHHKMGSAEREQYAGLHRNGVPTCSPWPDEVINYENMIHMVMLFEAMCIVDNGRTIDMMDVIEGWKLATKK